MGTPRAQDKQDDSFGSLRELLRKINQYHLAEQLAKRAKKIILPILQPGGAPTQWGPGILFIMFFGQVKDVCNIMLSEGVLKVNFEGDFNAKPQRSFSCLFAALRLRGFALKIALKIYLSNTLSG